MLLPLLTLFISSISLGQDFNVLLKEADRLEAIPNEKAAFNQFKEALKLQPQNVYVLTKCSELCSRIGNREKNTSTRDAFYTAAQSYARTALQFHPNNDEANVAMAIAIGRVALLKTGKEKISAVKEIKRHADLALKANNRNFKAWHIIGKWNYEVSNLNMMERAATKVFYGGLPNASLKESIRAYEFAKGLNPGFILNYLELAKAYNRNDERPKAIALLKIIPGLPSKTEDDPRIKTEAAALLKSWQ
jgi:tetratricopeptide (TPR) repeat protein